jgi:hypothetical protein
MDAGLSAALQLVQQIVQKAQQARANSDELKQLVQHVQALQPLLRELLSRGAALPASAAPVLDLLLGSLRTALSYVDKVATMSGVERFVRSGGIAEELAGVRQQLRDALLALQAVAVQISSGTSSLVKHLLARLDSWQVAQQQGVEQFASQLSEHRRSARDRHGRLESMLGSLLERMGTGVPQLAQDIDSTLQQPGLSDSQSEVRACMRGHLRCYI